jgi:O-acetyl-ADP-ribose deacetylase (regulator of RNase III)
VGPSWRGGIHEEPNLLSSCYRESLLLAGRKGLASIAFPAISTGIFGYPLEPAAQIAISITRETLPDAPSISRVVFCCFSASDAALYKKLLAGSTHA